MNNKPIICYLPSYLAVTHSALVAMHDLLPFGMHTLLVLIVLAALVLFDIHRISKIPDTQGEKETPKSSSFLELIILQLVNAAFSPVDHIISANHYLERIMLTKTFFPETEDTKVLIYLYTMFGSRNGLRMVLPSYIFSNNFYFY